MHIEITRPEVEALIQQRLRATGKKSVEDVIFDALCASVSPQSEALSTNRRNFDNLSDLLLNSPFAGANLDLERERDYPRTIVIE